MHHFAPLFLRECSQWGCKQPQIHLVTLDELALKHLAMSSDSYHGYWNEFRPLSCSIYFNTRKKERERNSKNVVCPTAAEYQQWLLRILFDPICDAVQIRAINYLSNKWSVWNQNKHDDKIYIIHTYAHVHTYICSILVVITMQIVHRFPRWCVYYTIYTYIFTILFPWNLYPGSFTPCQR